MLIQYLRDHGLWDIARQVTDPQGVVYAEPQTDVDPRVKFAAAVRRAREKVAKRIANRPEVNPSATVLPLEPGTPRFGELSQEYIDDLFQEALREEAVAPAAIDEIFKGELTGYRLTLEDALSQAGRVEIEEAEVAQFEGRAADLAKNVLAQGSDVFENAEEFRSYLVDNGQGVSEADIERIFSLYSPRVVKRVADEPPGLYDDPRTAELAKTLETFLDNVRATKSYFPDDEAFETWYQTQVYEGMTGEDQAALRDLYQRQLVKSPSLGGPASSPAQMMTAKASAIQAEVAAGRLTLEEAEFEWKKDKAQWDEDRAKRQEERDKRVDRLDAAYKLATTRLGATRELVGALPYIAPKGMEYIPGFGPGGPVEKLSGFSDSAFAPQRVEDFSVPFDPREAAEKAVAEVEAATKGLI